MTEQKKKRLEEVITSTNMTHSLKAWKTIRKLPNDPTTSNPPCLVNANQLLGMAEVTWHPHQNVLYLNNSRIYLHGIPFKRRRVQKSSGITKYNKSAGRNDVLVEQLKNIGPKAHMRLLAMLNKCFMENKHMETVPEYRHTEAWERLKFQRAIDHIPCVSDVQTLRKNNTEQDGHNHRTTHN